MNFKTKRLWSESVRVCGDHSHCHGLQRYCIYQSHLTWILNVTNWFRVIIPHYTVFKSVGVMSYVDCIHVIWSKFTLMHIHWIFVCSSIIFNVFIFHVNCVSFSDFWFCFDRTNRYKALINTTRCMNDQMDSVIVCVIVVYLCVCCYFSVSNMGRTE